MLSKHKKYINKYSLALFYMKTVCAVEANERLYIFELAWGQGVD